MRFGRGIAAIGLSALTALAAGEGGDQGESSRGGGILEYRQEIVIVFESAESAAKARPEILPLYRGFRAAISTRMDDSHLDGLRVAEIMEGFGMKGTFFLTSPSMAPQSPSEGVSFQGGKREAADYPSSLLPGGNSLGGHTLSHPFLPALNKNAAFREIALVRAELEAASSSAVNAFTYPYVRYQRDDPVPGESDCRADLEEMLRRSGYLILSEHRYDEKGDTGFLDALFLAVDGRDSGWYTEAEGSFFKKRDEGDAPLFVVSMHPWARAWGGASYPILKDFYARWGKDQSVWRCNHQEYAAYRIQRAHSSVELRREGKRVVMTIERPEAASCGASVPLSIAFPDAKPGEIVSVACDTADALPYASGGSYALDVGHDRDRPMPSAYGLVAPPPGGRSVADPRIPELEISWDIRFPGAGRAVTGAGKRSAVMTLRLKNALRDGQAVDSLSILPRLPLRWKAIGSPIAIGRIEAGGEKSVDIELAEEGSSPLYALGKACAIVQIEGRTRFSFRLHAVLEYEEPLPPTCLSSLPVNAFLALGPMPADTAPKDSSKTIKAAVKEARTDAEYSIGPWRQRLSWKAPDAALARPLAPEMAFTTGRTMALDAITWDPAAYYSHGKDLRWLLWAKITSPRPGAYALAPSRTIAELYIDGKKADLASFRLSGGEQDIMVHYAPKGGESGNDGASSISNYGARIIVLDETGRTAEGIVFSRPE
jgi:peptidoglycan/xylan/chitin deacetylase (PgdA/CDA1 family)